MLHVRHLPLLQFALACAVTLPAHAIDVSEWKQRQPLTVDRAGVVSVVVPPETLDTAKTDFSDLRVIDSADQEVPFLLVRPRRGPPTPVRPADFQATLTATTTQLLITGERDVALEAVVLETPARGFIKRARVETSPDGRNWRTHATDVPLFQQAAVEQLTVRTGPGPFVRITFDDTHSRPIAFTGARLIPLPEAAPTQQPLAVTVTRREEFAGETVFTIDVGAANVPLATLVFATPEPLFTRPVRVAVRELRDDAAVERTLATGSIFRVAFEGTDAAASLGIPLEFQAPARELLVHVDNGDSPPLAVTSLAATAWPVRLALNAPSAGAYAILSGNPRAAAPRYDVAALSTALRRNNVPAAVVGPLIANPAYRRAEALADTPLLGAALDPRPWLYRKAVRFAAAGVQQLELDLDVLARAQRSFADLRLVRDGAQVPYLLERPALSRQLELPHTAADDPRRPQLSRWQVKLPRAGLPVTRLTLTSRTPLFQRHLRIFERIMDRRGNSYERTLAHHTWNRTPAAIHPAVIALEQQPETDMLLIETDNGDNPPIELGAVTGAHAVARLLFKSDTGQVALYYGNAQATPPRYDLALVAGQILSAEKNVATLDPEEKARSDGWAAAALGGARGGILFWSVLGLVVVALLVVVAKLLPKPPAR